MNHLLLNKKLIIKYKNQNFILNILVIRIFYFLYEVFIMYFLEHYIIHTLILKKVIGKNNVVKMLDQIFML